MRPNIDIDWAIHGRIKDYAEANEMTLSEAYTEVLEAGLEALETQDQQ
jgi:macrodomain Ter protein organizer (MatP/YcbG family)